MGISKADVSDLDFVDAVELGSDGTAVFLTTTVVSTTSGTKVVVVNLASDGEGIFYSFDHPVQAGDFVTLTGTSGGLANGTYTVASVTNDTTFVVVESIATSTGGSASFKYDAGALHVGFDATKQNQTSSTNLQTAVTAVSNGLLLDSEPTGVGVSYTPTYSGSSVTLERWFNTATTNNIKTIAYTYTSGKVTTELTKVFATNGTTILAQKTTTYTYSGTKLTGSVTTRDV